MIEFAISFKFIKPDPTWKGSNVEFVFAPTKEEAIEKFNRPTNLTGLIQITNVRVRGSK